MTDTPSERRRRLEPVLRHVLASLPAGAAYSTAQLAAMLAPRLPAQAHYLSTDLVALANALPWLCVHSDPEVQTHGINKGRMIRRKTWGLLPGGHTYTDVARPWDGKTVEQWKAVEAGADAAHDVTMQAIAARYPVTLAALAERLPQTVAVVPDALTDALKRIDRIERLLISFGYQLPPLKD